MLGFDDYHVESSLSTKRYRAAMDTLLGGNRDSVTDPTGSMSPYHPVAVRFVEASVNGQKSCNLAFDGSTVSIRDGSRLYPGGCRSIRDWYNSILAEYSYMARQPIGKVSAIPQTNVLCLRVAL